MTTGTASSDENKLRAYLKRVTVELGDVRGRLKDLQARGNDPVAIVAMSCRMPGGVRSPEDLWDLVAAGKDTLREFPGDRGWDLANLFDPDPDRPGTSYVRQGGFMPEAGEFDAAFFGVSDAEAVAMDPQHRLLLETTWEALERAGIDPASLRGSDTAVYAGCSVDDYTMLLADPPEDVAAHRLTGGGNALAARVSGVFGLTGPSMTIDTACSSSLVALHLAVQSLRQGECSLALVSGVSVISTPQLFVDFSRQRGLAPDGRVKAFAGAADGTAWCDAVGTLVVERLSDARRLGHRVLAVVRGSAVNQDGASNGLTAPNGPSQQRVIRAALNSGALSPAEVDAVEAHGTGTRLGDPIEAEALLATYGQGRPAGRPLRLGSVKSNFGHAGAAAGVTGVIKMVQAMRHGLLPATLHVDEPTPMVDWDAGAVELLTKAEAWPDTGRPRRAAVSAFGVSGTNAHVILEQAPAEPEPAAPVRGAAPDTAGAPLVLSAASPRALRDQARRLAEHLALNPALRLTDVAHSLATTRAALRHRAAVTDTGSVPAALELLARGAPGPGVVTGTAREPGRVALVLPEEGTELLASAARLLDSSAAFAARLRPFAEAVEARVPWRVEEVLRGAASSPSYEGEEVGRPVLFAVALALAGLWQDHGVRVERATGHALGDLVSDYLAGAQTLQDAVRAVTGAGAPAGPARPVAGALLADGYRTFVMAGAAVGIEEAAALAGALVVHALPVGEGLAQAWTAGLAVRWPAPQGVRTVELPTYAFQHKKYWVGARPAAAPAAEGPDADFWAAVEGQDRAALARLLDVAGAGAVEPVLPALAQLRDEARRQAAVAHWRYRTQWHEVAPPAGRAPSGRWLVVLPAQSPASPASRQAQPWIGALEHGGASVVRLAVAPGTDKETLAAQLAPVVEAGPLRGVVCALPLDDSPHPGRPALGAGLTGTLALVGALAALGAEVPVWSLTRGAVAAAPGDAVGSPAQAAVWGLGLVLAEEHPQLWGGTIDLPADDPDSTAAGLLAAVLTGEEDRVALRGPSVLARRVVRAPLENRPGDAWRPDGTVLVTQGTHGMGAAVARHLAGAGARHLLLSAAQEPGPGERAALEAEFAALGARVTIVRCDFTNLIEGAQVLAALPGEEPLTAVFHCAEVLEESPLDDVELASLERVLGAKAVAATVLDELTRDLDLSAFVLFSSIAGSMGVGVGLGAFAAANAQLDALAQRRRAAGRRATAVAWGVWVEEFADPARARLERARHERLRRRGIPAVAPEHALTVLDQALDGGEGDLLAAEIVWPDYVPATAAGRGPLFAALPEAAAALPAGPDADAAARTPALALLDARARHEALLGVVRAEIAAVLGLAGAAEVDAGRGFLELGMDSLTTVELRNRLAAATGVRLTVRQIFDERTPQALAGAVSAALGEQEPGGAGSAPAAHAPAESTLAGLFRTALAAGRAGEFTELLATAADFRPVFGEEGGADLAAPVLLARGGSGPALFCLPTVLATSGPEQFARLAAGFGGASDVFALALPGFREDEALPAGVEALAAALAATVLDGAGDAPYALLGYSSGGLLAHSVAARLEAEGAGPAAVVLLDTFPVGGGRLAEFGPALVTAMAERAEVTGLDDARLSAMGGYLRLLADWRPAALSAPTLLVRAGDHGWGSSGPDRTELAALATVLDVPGDHFTLIEEHAPSTARAVGRWLAQLPLPARAA
ncbi:beta-ketoacyl synthase N-terminal-like domain-containing protein [Streptomyces sp. NPDC023838]|uniref:beta-ketoacyl synthase N-terminal-like domain-containing protein n=1 Tax=Streptomyces sp. NPDC023838 TaxID=3154325 RepID=UPI0033F1F846